MQIKKNTGEKDHVSYLCSDENQFNGCQPMAKATDGNEFSVSSENEFAETNTILVNEENITVEIFNEKENTETEKFESINDIAKVSGDDDGVGNMTLENSCEVFDLYDFEATEVKAMFNGNSKKQ